MDEGWMKDGLVGQSNVVWKCVSAFLLQVELL